MSARHVIPINLDNLAKVQDFAHKQISPNYVALEPDFFRWQFVAPIGGDEEYSDCDCFGVEDKNSIVAVANARKMKMWIGDKVHTGAWLHEWFADPNYPGAGLQLLRHITRSKKFMGVTGHSLYSMNGWARLQQTCWFNLFRLFLVIDPIATHRLLFSAGPQSLSFLNLAKLKVTSKLASQEISTFDDAYDFTWKAARTRFLIATDRTSAMMNWRYTKHPAFHYRILKIDTIDGPVYFVWRDENVSGHEKAVARITDIIGSPQGIANATPAFAQYLAERGETSFCDFFCSNGEVVAALLRVGMQHVITTSEFDLPRLFSPLYNDPRKNINVAFSVDSSIAINSFLHDRTYITKGDCNQDRPNERWIRTQ